MNNKIAMTFKIIAVVTYIVGFFVGLGLAYQPVEGYEWLKEFVSTVALTYWVAAFISGTLFLGIGEIINLLQQLVDKAGKTSAITRADENAVTSESFDDLPAL